MPKVLKSLEAKNKKVCMFWVVCCNHLGLAHIWLTFSHIMLACNNKQVSHCFFSGFNFFLSNRQRYCNILQIAFASSKRFQGQNLLILHRYQIIDKFQTILLLDCIVFIFITKMLCWKLVKKILAELWALVCNNQLLIEPGETLIFIML